MRIFFRITFFITIGKKKNFPVYYKSAFTGQCMYCGHCAPCSVKIDVAYVNKYLDLASIQDELAETVKNHYELLAHHASECIECGLCMDNCPFGEDIIGKMKEAAKLFGK